MSAGPGSRKLSTVAAVFVYLVEDRQKFRVTKDTYAQWQAEEEIKFLHLSHYALDSGLSFQSIKKFRK